MSVTSLLKRSHAPRATAQGPVPARLGNGFRNWVEEYFNAPFPELFPRGQSDSFMPPVNLSEGEEEFVVRVEVPGMQCSDIEVQLMGNQLQISGERTMEEEENTREYHRVESHYGAFSRTVPLPTTAALDAARTEANCAQGILTITIPKAEPTPSSRIRVKSA